MLDGPALPVRVVHCLACLFAFRRAPCWVLGRTRLRCRTTCAAHHVLCGMGKHRTSSDTPGDFDIYLLAQTWAPQFCCTKSDRCTTVSWAYSAS